MTRRLLIVLLLAFQSAFAIEVESILFDNANPPFMYLENQVAQGIYPNLIREVLKRMKVKIETYGVPWQRALKELDEAHVGVGGIVKNSEQLKKYDYTEPLYKERLTLYVLKGKQFPIKTIADLKGKSVGVILGWSLGDEFDKAAADKVFYTFASNSDEQNFMKLKMGRINAVVAIKEAGDIFLKKYPDTFEQVPIILLENESFVAFHKKSNQLAFIKQFNQTLNEIKKDGTYKKIVDQSMKATD